MEIKSIADAISVLDYLHRRELLCNKCGTNIATHEHAGSYHHRCKDCLSPHGLYTAYRIPNELEKRICDALNRWNAANPPDERWADPGNPPGLQGDK